MEEAKTKDVGFLQEHADEGFENITAEDFTIPFLRILQVLSPQVDEDATEYIKGAKPGMFFNTVTERLYGATIQLIPIIHKKIWLEWMPNRGGLVGRHEPKSIKINNSEFTKWKTPEGNIITEHYVFYCLVLGHFEEGPVAFSLSSTGIRHARNWNTQLMMTRLPNGARAPYFSSVWELTVVKNTNNQGSWFMVGDKKTTIQRLRFVTQEEFSQYVLPFKESLSSLKELDYSQLEDHSERVVSEEKTEGEAKEANVPY